MTTKLFRFTSRVVSLVKKTVGDDQEVPVQNGEDRYANWVNVALNGFQEYLGHPYRRLIDVLHEMPNIVGIRPSSE